MLSFKNVSYAYSNCEHKAVKNINFEVKAGEIVLCTGASGCGKTTLMRLANGLCPHHYKGKLEGEVYVCGFDSKEANINLLSNYVGTLFQDPEQQFFALNVEDELAFILECRNTAPEKIHTYIQKSLQDFGIKHIEKSSIHDLSEGQKQKVGLASLHTHELKVLILDEPTANLDPEATLDLAQKLLQLKQAGMAIFIVDHRLYWLEGIADRVMVMQEGEIKEESDFSMLYSDDLRAKYGLRAAKVQDTRKTLPPPNKELAEKNGLYVKNLSFAYKGKENLYTNNTMHLATGITALIGDNGTGKTTLARILTGLNKTKEGSFYVREKEVPQKEMIKHIGIVLQNADHQLHMRTVLEEVETCYVLAYNQKNRELSFFKRKKMKNSDFTEQSLELLDTFGLKELAPRHPQSLSGGEKQRVIIACALAKNPDVLILDEPTSGLDGKNMQRIKKALEKIAHDEKCILVITHDLELIEQACTSSIQLPLIN